LHQDTTTLSLYGAYEEETACPSDESAAAAASDAPAIPRPAYGDSKDHRGDLKQVVLSLGLSGQDGLALRLGVRDGNTSESVEMPVAIEESLALGLEGLVGIVADSKAYSPRSLGLCLEKQVGLVTLVPRTCGVRQELERWAQQQAPLPM
jgi:transposase